MIDQSAARVIAEKSVPTGLVINDQCAEELEHGWMFLFGSDSPASVGGGSQGVIINKWTGKPFMLGSAFPVERDARFYDLGYQFRQYDLVIIAVHDLDHTLDTLEEIGPSVIEPSFESGEFWKLQRRLTRAEIRSHLAHLPCVFANIQLYFRLEILDEARRGGTFQFEALEHSASHG